MKKLLALLFLAFAVFVLLDRQRLYLWDPLATVTRDGHPDPAAHVRINFSNDVLLQDGPSDTDASRHPRLYLVQHWNNMVTAPARLVCAGRAACLSNADQATGEPIVAGTRGGREPFAGVTMTSRRVEFVDEDGALVEVVLR